MNEGEKSYCALGMVVGFGFTVILAVGLQNALWRHWQSQAIEHGAAKHNATSGEFEWIEKVQVTE
jgi:hypothetical protein